MNTNTAKTFTLVIEEAPEVELKVKWDKLVIPNIVRLPDNSVCYLVERYASREDRYRYTRSPVIPIADLIFS